jgi:spore photoproduct lyase
LEKQNKTMLCRVCDYKKNAPEGICSVLKGSDGLPVRCVGLWAKDKCFYLGRYFEIFTAAMRNKWKGELFYIDLFAGCGKCRVRETGEEIDGSALISLSVKYPFKRYFLVELNSDAADILRKRIENLSYKNRVHIIQGDCNEKIDEIIAEVPQRSLSLTVIDPTGLHIKFETIRKLTKDRRIDLVITYPEGMDIKRNLSKYIKQSHSILDDYIGDKDWRLLFPKDIKQIYQLTDIHVEKSLITHYRKKLGTLSYKVKSGDEILIRSSQKNLPLYYLLFASKHPLGHTFWRKISSISPTGQMKFSLNNNYNSVHEYTAKYSPVKPKILYKDFRLLNGKEERLVERINDGSIITRFDKTPFPENSTDIICPHFLELKWAYGCPYDCSWCYLKGTFRFNPNGTKPVVKPYEKIELHIGRFLEEVNTPEILNTGEIADSLMHENSGNPFSKFIIPIFETQRLHKVLFLTKSINVKNLLEIEPHNQAIISFSLNAIPVAKLWEKKAPPVLKRIEAAKKVYQVGYEVRLRIDPMVPVDGWEESYLQLVNLIFDNLIPERITLGSLRGLQSTINGCLDKSWVKYLRESSNWGKKIDFNTRLAMYSVVIEHLRSKYKYNNIALCKETIAMWNSLKMDYRQIKCNCIW